MGEAIDRAKSLVGPRIRLQADGSVRLISHSPRRGPRYRDKHREKRLRRVRKDLVFWRRSILRDFEFIGRTRYAPSAVKQVEKSIAANVNVILAIDELCVVIGVILGERYLAEPWQRPEILLIGGKEATASVDG